SGVCSLEFCFKGARQWGIQPVNMNNQSDAKYATSSTNNVPESATSQPKQQQSNLKDAALAFVVAFFRLTVATLVLLGLVVAKVVDGSSESENGGAAYIVDISVARVLTVSSWCATVVVLIPGFLMTLVSFYV